MFGKIAQFFDFVSLAWILLVEFEESCSDYSEAAFFCTISYWVHLGYLKFLLLYLDPCDSNTKYFDLTNSYILKLCPYY